VRFEQGKSDFVFEIAYLLAQRRLRDVQLQSGARHVLLLAHSDEVTQVPKLHKFIAYRRIRLPQANPTISAIADAVRSRSSERHETVKQK